MKISARTIAFTALLAAVICALAPWTIPVGVIPISLATLGVYLAAVVIDAKHGAAAVLTYIALGAIGVPVFSGGRGGFGVIAGPTGGYITGYFFLAVIAGLIVDAAGGEKRVWIYPIAMTVGTVALYAFGTGWYMISTGAEFAPALAACVLPFLAGDAVKIAVATAVGFPVRRALRKTVLRARSDRCGKGGSDDADGSGGNKTI